MLWTPNTVISNTIRIYLTWTTIVTNIYTYNVNKLLKLRVSKLDVMFHYVQALF